MDKPTKKKVKNQQSLIIFSIFYAARVPENKTFQKNIPRLSRRGMR